MNKQKVKASKNVKILHYISDRTGIFMYRCYFPSIALQEFTNHNVMYSRDCNYHDVDNLAEMNWADIVVFHRQHTPQALDAARYIKKLGKKIVYEIDDDWTDLNDDNRFKHLVDRDPTIISGMKEFASLADAVTVTQPRLQKKMQQHSENVHVIPNYISDYFYRVRTIKQKKDESRVALFWAGAANHLDSLKEVVPAITEVLNKYPETDLWICGHNYTELFPLIPKSRLNHVPWSGLENYSAMYTFGDIGIAPMADNGFNASKSNIRVLEQSYFNLPIVASNRYAYAETIEHGKTGYLADDHDGWVKYLSALVESKQLRESIGINARENVMKNWTLEQKVRDWADFYEGLAWN